MSNIHKDSKMKNHNLGEDNSICKGPEKQLEEIIKELNGNISIKKIYPGSVLLKEFYHNTLKGDYLAKGVGMYHTGAGKINFSNCIPKESVIVKAYLYWSVIRYNNVPINPTGKLNHIDIEGNLISTANLSVQCDDAFYCDVTSIVNTEVNILEDFPCDCNYNTWGCSIVVIYSNPKLCFNTIIINHGNLVFDRKTLSTTFTNFKLPELLTESKTTYIVGSGNENCKDEAIFNEVVLNSPDAFSGKEGVLWDTLTLDISDFINIGDTIEKAVINSVEDTLIWVAQVIKLPSTES